jgi:hypothetical protein
MIKKISICVLLVSLSIVSSYGQANPYYNVTQSNQQSLYSNNFEVASVGIGNTYNPVYPAYTIFLTDGYVLENIPGSKHIQGLPIGFKFPYAGEEFDIYAVNAKGYIVLGKSWEGGMTVYADTLIETSTDTVFTDKNKYLISGLYSGKDMDLQGDISLQVYKAGFEGERRLFIVQANSKAVVGGSVIITSNTFELKQTGEITIRPQVQILFNNTNNNLHSYGTFMQRYGAGFTDYIYTQGKTADSWFHIKESFTPNTDYKYGILRDTIKPNLVSVYPYTMTYLPKVSNFICPVPIRWNPNPPGVYNDSAYIANDYEELQGDTLSNTDRVWWYSDMRDSLRFDVYLGTDEISMKKYKTGLMADTMLINFNYILGLVNLPLDSLAAGQKYFIKIHTIHPSEDTTVCGRYSFYTKPKEQIKNYCRSDEPLFSGIEGAFAFANLDLNTLHFHPDSNDILGILYYKTLVPDTGSWTTNLQQGQSYLLQLSTASFLDLPAYYYIASIFIDSNNDGVFDGQDGYNNYTYGISNKQYNPFMLYIPTNAVPGKTRLRVMVEAYGNNTPFPGPCEKDASIADFIVTIVQAPGCNLSYSDTIVSPSCATYSNGGMSIIPKEGTAPYHIQWNTGNPKDTLFTLLDLASPARQRATITDATGCNIRTSMLQLTQPAPLHIDTMLHSNPSWIAFIGGTKPYQATITGDKTETRYAVNDTIFLTDLPVGNYHIKATDSNSCNMKEYVLKQTVLGIVTADAKENTFILYPNPATNYMQISGIHNNAAVVIYSMDGKKVFEGSSTNQQRIVLPDIASALYFVKVEEENRRNTYKLIVK